MNNDNTTYQSPEIEVTDICAESIICASADNMVVRDPWSYDEEEW